MRASLPKALAQEIVDLFAIALHVTLSCSHEGLEMGKRDQLTEVQWLHEHEQEWGWPPWAAVRLPETVPAVPRARDAPFEKDARTFFS